MPSLSFFADIVAEATNPAFFSFLRKKEKKQKKNEF